MSNADCEVQRVVLTDTEWQACADPAPMLALLRQQRLERSKAGRRKLRLYACACCRLHWSRLSEKSRRAVEITERYADGLADRKEFGWAQRNAKYDFAGPPPRNFAEGLARYTFDGALNWVTSSAATAAQLTGHHFETIVRRESPARHAHELSRQAALIREIFGNPFRCVSASTDWLTPEATSLAERIYSEQAFEQMPALARVLAHGGCSSSDLLLHCESGTEHARGCWAIDLMLGRHCQMRIGAGKP